MKKLLFALTLFAAIPCIPALSSSIVVGPTSNSPNAFPFGGEQTIGTVYQQAYASADFTGLGPIVISSIDFLHGSGTLATSTYSLYFSTITAGINTLSDTNFSSNLGSDNTLFATEFLTGAAPSTLTFVGTPFTYDPANGNLLLDILVSPGGVFVGDSSAFYQAADGNASGIFSRYSNFGGGFTGWGLVTEFDYTPAATAPTPEPSSILLLSTGVLGAFYSLRRRLIS